MSTPWQRLNRQLEACLVEHLKTGREAKPPEAGFLLWTAFRFLSATRSSNGYGANPISFVEIEAYIRLWRLPLSERHVATLLMLDRVWLDHAYSKQATAPDGVKTLPPSSGQAVNPAVFDAVFG